jgi:hypothetical protein
MHVRGTYLGQHYHLPTPYTLLLVEKAMEKACMVIDDCVLQSISALVESVASKLCFRGNNLIFNLYGWI